MEMGWKKKYIATLRAFAISNDEEKNGKIICNYNPLPSLCPHSGISVLFTYKNYNV